MLELTRSVVRVTDGQPAAKFYVHRAGSLQGPVTFSWRTESGTAQADRDFVPVASRSEVIEDGTRGLELRVPLLPDATRKSVRAFTIRIERAGDGAALGDRTLAQVEIVPAGGEVLQQ